jgi:hypothetical protein
MSENSLMFQWRETLVLRVIYQKPCPSNTKLLLGCKVVCHLRFFLLKWSLYEDSKGKWNKINNCYTLVIDCFERKHNDKWQFYDHFQAFFDQLYEYLSQNWGSDDHFDVPYESRLWLVQKSWHKMQIFPFLFFYNFVQKHLFAFFAFCFLYQLRFRLVKKHLKMIVWISVLWKMNIQLVKKWPDMVVKWPFIRCYHLWVSQVRVRP